MMTTLSNSMFNWTATALPTLGELDLIHRLWLRRTSVTEAGRFSDDMFMWIFWFCVIWFVGLMGLMIFFVIRYRRRKGQIAQASSSHNTPLEIAWTVIPSLFLVYMFFQGFWGYMDKQVAPGEALELRLTGYKWNWKFTYPNGEESPIAAIIGSRPVPVFYIPAETPIKLRMNSNDVMHAFWVPDFRIKNDLLPNRYTSVWFKASGPNDPANAKHLKTHPMTEKEASAREPFVPSLAGVPFDEHWVFCAEYCGDEHSEMAALIRVIPRDKWDLWVDNMGPPLPPLELGQRVWKNQCSACHTIDGSKNTGPSWKNIFGHQAQMASGDMMMVDENYIRESILVPGAQIVMGYPNQMPSFKGVLNEKQIDGVIAYIKSLSEKHQPGDAGSESAKPAEKPAKS